MPSFHNILVLKNHMPRSRRCRTCEANDWNNLHWGLEVSGVPSGILLSLRDVRHSQKGKFGQTRLEGKTAHRILFASRTRALVGLMAFLEYRLAVFLFSSAPTPSSLPPTPLRAPGHRRTLRDLLIHMWKTQPFLMVLVKPDEFIWSKRCLARGEG